MPVTGAQTLVMAAIALTALVIGLGLVGFNLERIMRTLYRIDSYQASYFVIDSFQRLIDATAPDFTPLYARASLQQALAADASVAGEKTY